MEECFLRKSRFSWIAIDMRKGPSVSFSHLNLMYTTMPDTWKMLRKYLLHEMKQMDQSRERRVTFVSSSTPADNRTEMKAIHQ